MAGSSKTIFLLKQSIDQLRSEMNVKLGAMQTQLDALEERLDRYDKPAAPSPGTQPPARKKSASKKRPVPIPEKPDVLKAAEGETD